MRFTPTTDVAQIHENYCNTPKILQMLGSPTKSGRQQMKAVVSGITPIASISALMRRSLEFPVIV